MARNWCWLLGMPTTGAPSAIAWYAVLAPPLQITSEARRATRSPGTMSTTRTLGGTTFGLARPAVATSASTGRRPSASITAGSALTSPEEPRVA